MSHTETNLRQQIAHLTKQRDELLAALTKCVNQLEIVLPPYGKVHDEHQALICAKAAIKNAKGVDV
jgi:hypothetical protein